jgi:hypothetical protein
LLKAEEKEQNWSNARVSDEFFELLKSTKEDHEYKYYERVGQMVAEGRTILQVDFNDIINDTVRKLILSEYKDRFPACCESVERLVAIVNSGYAKKHHGKFSVEFMNIPESLQTTQEKRVEEPMDDVTQPMTFSELSDILSSTIKKDESAKIITFGAMLLAQTEDDQINIAFQAESSSGKSYIPIELSQYFPEEEQRISSYTSPQAFFHEKGSYDKERDATIVDFEHKIIVFLDQPHYQLLERLRPILSHDKKELTHKIVDKVGRGKMVTKHVIVRGYPSVIFCTTKLNPDEQEKTRLILLSPSVDQEKLKESLKVLALRKSDPEKYWTKLESDPKRQWLIARVKAIRKTGLRNIVIPDPDLIYQRYHKEHPFFKSRDQRDLPRVISLIKFHALLNCLHRNFRDYDTIEASDEDIEVGFALYNTIAEPNEHGLSPSTWNFYKNVIKPLLNADKGTSRKEIQEQHYSIYRKPISAEALRREILPELESAGLILQEPDPDDKRKSLVYPTDASPISPQPQSQKIPNSDSAIPENRGKDYGVQTNLPVYPLTGICAVCNSSGAELRSANKGSVYLHNECEGKWPEKL